MSLLPSRLALVGRTLLGLSVVGAFFAPSLAAFATSRQVVAGAMKPPLAVIRVRPFRDMSSDSCTSDSPLHQGPIERIGQLSNAWSAHGRLDQAAESCLTATGQAMTLLVSVDAAGRLTRVQAAAGDEELATCAETAVRRPGRLAARGPGTLQIGYFMGNRRR